MPRPALQPHLATTLLHLQELLAPYPQILQIVLTTLDGNREQSTTFLLDLSTDPQVLVLCQQQGQTSVLSPLFRACRAWVWSAHRTRMRLLGLSDYLM